MPDDRKIAAGKDFSTEARVKAKWLKPAVRYFEASDLAESGSNGHFSTDGAIYS
jgi:hypothetical protein